MSRVAETRIVSLILARLYLLEKEGHPCHFWRANTGVASTADRFIKFGERGQSDIIGVAAGRFVGIEVKSETGRVSDDQRAWGDKIERAGGKYIIARRLEDALPIVRQMMNLPC